MKKVIFLVLLSPLFSCDGNYRDVVINGHVIDSLTAQPVAGSKINVACWVYDTKIWESRKVIKDTTSDASGNFSILFEKGEVIDVEVQHPLYQFYRFSKTLDRSDNEIDFKLKKDTHSDLTVNKELLQGIWGTDPLENADFEFRGDSLVYTEHRETPYFFSMKGDSINVDLDGFELVWIVRQLKSDRLVIVNEVGIATTFIRFSK